MDRVNMKQAISDFVSKYKFAMIVFAVGLLLMILPDVGDKEQIDILQEPAVLQEENMEQKLSDILSLVKGAGQVQVMLSYVSGQETIYQTDRNMSQGEKNQNEKVDTVTVTDS